MGLKSGTLNSRYSADPGWRLVPAAFEQSPIAPTRSAWTVSSALARCWTVWRREGLTTVGIKMLGETLYRRLRLLVLDLDDPAVRIASCVDAGIRILDGTDQDTDLYTAFRVDTPAREFHRRLANGGKCFAAIHGEDVVSATWAYVSQGPYPYLGACFEAGPSGIVLSDSYTLPAFRGHGLSPAVIVAIARYYHDRGFRYVVTSVLPENAASLRARRKTHFRVCGTAGFIGPRWWRRYFCRIDPQALPWSET